MCSTIWVQQLGYRGNILDSRLPQYWRHFLPPFVFHFNMCKWCFVCLIQQAHTAVRARLWPHVMFCELKITSILKSSEWALEKTGLKVNDQLVAYSTRFSAVRLENHVWSYHRALKAKVHCDFSSAYSPDHSNILRLINTINIRYNINRQKNKKPNFPLDSPNSNIIFLHVLWYIQLCWHMQMNEWSMCSLHNRWSCQNWSSKESVPCLFFSFLSVHFRLLQVYIHNENVWSFSVILNDDIR